MRARDLDYSHTMPADFENGENVTVAKFELTFYTIPAQFENGWKFDGKNLLKDFNAKKYTCSLGMDLSRSKTVEKCLFSSFLSVHMMPFPKCAS